MITSVLIVYSIKLRKRKNKMKENEIRNKKNETLVNKEGKTLLENTFEVGDEFVPVYNRVREVRKEVEIKGKKTIITDYVIKADVRNKEKGEEYGEVFVKLTPTQANAVKKLIEDGVLINQELFKAYKYVSETYGEQIGVGLVRNQVEAKKLKDFK